MTEDDYGKKVITVREECTRDWVDESKVTIENIEEDFYGRDVVTWKCNSCGQYHKSIRLG